MANKQKVIQKPYRLFWVLGLFILLVLILGFLSLHKFQKISNVPNTNLTNTEITQILNTATIKDPDTDNLVALKNGGGTVDNGAGTINLTQPYLAVRTSAGYDLFAVINANYGGSGVFASVVLFNYDNGNLSFEGSYPVGDRVPVTEINGPSKTQNGNYEITINYLDRSPNQPMSDTPKLPKSLKLNIENDQLPQAPTNH